MLRENDVVRIARAMRIPKDGNVTAADLSLSERSAAVTSTLMEKA